MTNPNYEYIGVFFPKTLQMELLYKFKDLIPEDWVIYADHCTMVHRSCPDQTVVPFLKLFIGRTVQFEVTGYGFSDRALAAKVSLPSMNKVSHITIACVPGARPVESNAITEWYDFEEPLECLGWIEIKSHN